MSELTKVFRKLTHIIKPEFTENFPTLVTSIIVERLENLSELDIKNCVKDNLDQLIFDLRVFLELGTQNKEDRAKIIEITELQVGLQYLKCTFLEKRIRGLQDINYMIDRVWKTFQVRDI